MTEEGWQPVDPKEFAEFIVARDEQLDREVQEVVDRIAFRAQRRHRLEAVERGGYD